MKKKHLSCLLCKHFYLPVYSSLMHDFEKMIGIFFISYIKCSLNPRFPLIFVLSVGTKLSLVEDPSEFRLSSTLSLQLQCVVSEVLLRVVTEVRYWCCVWLSGWPCWPDPVQDAEGAEDQAHWADVCCPGLPAQTPPPERGADAAQVSADSTATGQCWGLPPYGKGRFGFRSVLYFDMEMA